MSQEKYFYEIMGTGICTNVEFFGTRHDGFRCCIYLDDDNGSIVCSDENAPSVDAAFTAAWDKVKRMSK